MGLNESRVRRTCSTCSPILEIYNEDKKENKVSQPSELCVYEINEYPRGMMFWPGQMERIEREMQPSRIQLLEEKIQRKRCKQRELMNDIQKLQARGRGILRDILIGRWINEALELCTEREQIIEDALWILSKLWYINVTEELMQIWKDQDQIIEIKNSLQTCRPTLTQLVELFIRLVLLAVFFGNAAKLKDLTRPGRNRICCVKVFLLSNEGAHAYNGNGAFFTRQRREDRIPLVEDNELERQSGFKENRIVIQKTTFIYCNTRLHDKMKELEDANDVKDASDNAYSCTRIPSDKQLGRMAHRIGKEYQALAIELGHTLEELFHICQESAYYVDRNFAILIRWKKQKADKATFKELAEAMKHVGINPAVVFANIDCD